MSIDYSVVLDENERQRMLEDGYLPEVIDWHAKDRYNRMHEEFLSKNRILGRYYEATPYFSFVADVFPDLEQLMVVTAEEGYKEMTVEELMEYQAFRSDVYVPPVSFINGHNAASSCKDVYALVVDIDRIDPETLSVIIDNGNLGNRIPMPSYIVNSGSGVHFYYVFAEPVPFYFVNRSILDTMRRRLCGITQKNIYAKTDWHGITQPLRLPGSQTKLGQTVTGWKCGNKWHAWALASRLGIDGDALDLQRRPLQSQREYRESKAQRSRYRTEPEGTTGKKKGKKNWKSSLAGKTGFYTDCLRRCYEKTPQGTRYRSMMALTVVARKVEYPKEQLEQDLFRLVEHYNATGKRMTYSEAKKAMKMYKDKALTVKSETLEEWFGWEFRRADAIRREMQRAKGRTRTKEEAWRIARGTRDILYPDGGWRNKSGAPSKAQVVQEWRKENPDGKPKDCIQDTGLAKNTVYKWWSGGAAPAKDKTARQTEQADMDNITQEQAEDFAAKLVGAIMSLPPEEREKLLADLAGRK